MIDSNLDVVLDIILMIKDRRVAPKNSFRILSDNNAYSRPSFLFFSVFNPHVLVFRRNKNRYEFQAFHFANELLQKRASRFHFDRRKLFLLRFHISSTIDGAFGSSRLKGSSTINLMHTQANFVDTVVCVSCKLSRTCKLVGNVDTPKEGRNNLVDRRERRLGTTETDWWSSWSVQAFEQIRHKLRFNYRCSVDMRSTYHVIAMNTIIVLTKHSARYVNPVYGFVRVISPRLCAHIISRCTRDAIISGICALFCISRYMPPI